MRVLNVRNVHEALPAAYKLLHAEGVRRDSRNGPVLQGPPVTTVYNKPWERVLFWEARDANPFFHLYEALWMLAGREDCQPLARYAKNMLSYSDNGNTLNGAYGFRWRSYFYVDQLEIIARQLRANPEDRRCVLQMWSASTDLGALSKDVPCNVSAVFGRGPGGELNLTVFCRSNDIIWGAYGANAVQFSMLLEYMALWVDCAMGTYSQVSVNWHGYLDTLGKLSFTNDPFYQQPYETFSVGLTTLPEHPPQIITPVMSLPMGPSITSVTSDIHEILQRADAEVLLNDTWVPEGEWGSDVTVMLRAHEHYRKTVGVDRYTGAINILDSSPNRDHDWLVAGKQWMSRRLTAFLDKSVKGVL